MDFISPIIKSLYNKLFWKEIETQQTKDKALEDEISQLKASIEKVKIRKQLDFPESLGTIKLTEINALLREVMPKTEIFLSDMEFNLTSVEKAKIFTQETNVQYSKYIMEGHDCENFSWALLGYWSSALISFPFGFAWSSTHSFNVMIDNNKEIWICEPQLNSWTKLKDVTDPKYLDWRLVVM